MASGEIGFSERRKMSARQLLANWQEEFGRFSAIILVASSIVLIWVGIWLKHEEDVQHAEAAAQRNATTLARSLEEQLRRTVGAVDQTLLYVRDLHTRAPAEFNLGDWQQNGRFLTNFAFQISLTDKDGFVLSSNLASSGMINVRDREHFSVHLGSTEDRLFISKPVFGRLSQKWSIQLTRRMAYPDGRFAGVIVGSIDPQELSKFYSTVQIGERGSIVLLGEDGFIRARSPFDPGMLSTSIQDAQLWQMHVTSRDTNFITHSDPDGVKRLYAVHKIRELGLVLMVGQALDHVYQTAGADWSGDLVVGLLGTLWVIIFLVVITGYQRGLARSRDQAEAGTRARSEFLTTMSHEIRTPLNGVIGLAELLGHSPLNLDQKKMVGAMKESAGHLLLLLNDVLDFSKLDADRLELEQMEFSIHDIARGTIEMLRATAQNKGILLDFDIAPGVPEKLRGDPGRIRQILLNLIGNGIKFTERGHVWLSVSGVHCDKPPGYQLQLRVVDTGCGIGAEQQKNLFSSFSQADSSISRRYGGTGLGLAISQRLAARMGGGISVFSEPGKGSTFEVSLYAEPVALGAASKEVAEQPAPELPMRHERRRFRILLAEDNRTNQFVVGQMLRQLGQEVDVVADGVQAVAAVQRHPYDLVLMDVMMPEMDGIAATRAIRALNGPASKVMISALTANSLDSDRAACLVAGMNLFISKPVTRKMLESLLDRLSAPPALPEPAPGKSASAADPGLQAGLPAKITGTPNPIDSHAFGPAAYQELVRDLGEATAREIMYTFLEETDEYLDQLFESVAEQNRIELGKVAHALKGSAQTVGFGVVSDLAQLVEKHAEFEAIDELHKRVDLLAAEYRALRSCVQPMQQVA